MTAEGDRLLTEEKIPMQRRRYRIRLDCRYVKQYHEVPIDVPFEAVRSGDVAPIAAAFHAEHNRMYGYSLEKEGASIELINIRLRAVGVTEKPRYGEEEFDGPDASGTIKGERMAFIPEERTFRPVPVYDGHATRFGNFIAGPALIEQVNTTLFLSGAFDCVSDRYGSFVVYLKGRENLVADIAAGARQEVRV